jgi:hypothetical protein
MLEEKLIMKRSDFRILAVLAMVSAVALLATSSAVAQSSEGLRIGILGGVNYNYVDAATEDFVEVPGNGSFASHDFSGASLIDGYAGLSGEYQFNELIGATLRASYDARCVEKEDNGSTFSPRLVYVSIEPGVRLNLGMPQLYAMVGGTVAIKAHTEYDYSPGTTEEAQDIVGADLDNVRDVAFGAWAGFGYDLQVAKMGGMNWFVTPFAEASYLFDQKEADVPMQEEKWWNTLSVRGGLQLKLQF